jgi:hypothetical protein
MEFPKFRGERKTLVRRINGWKGEYATTVAGATSLALAVEQVIAAGNHLVLPALVMFGVAAASAMCGYAAFDADTREYWDASQVRWGFATSGWLCLAMAVIQFGTGVRKVGGVRLSIHFWDLWVHDPAFRPGAVFLGASVVFGLVATGIRHKQRRISKEPFAKIAAWMTIMVTMPMVVIGALVEPSFANPMVAFGTGAAFALVGVSKVWRGGSRNRTQISREQYNLWTAEAVRLGEIVAALVSLLIALMYAVSAATHAHHAAYVKVALVYCGGTLVWMLLQLTLSPKSNVKTD